MALGRDNLDVLHADPAKLVGHKIGGCAHIALMFVEGADTRNAEKIFEFVKKALLIIPGEIYRRGSHGFVLSFEAKRRWFAMLITIKRFSIPEAAGPAWGRS
jgi:hypothetical protein